MIPFVPSLGFVGAACVAVAIASGAAGYTARGWQADRDVAELQRARAAEIAVSEAAARREVDAARAEERRTAQVTQEAMTHAQIQLEDLFRARNTAGAAAAAGVGLRQRAAAAVAARCDPVPGAAATAPAGAASAAAPDLLADMLGRLDEAARLIAATADERAIRGSACESIADQMRASTP